MELLRRGPNLRIAPGLAAFIFILVFSIPFSSANAVFLDPPTHYSQEEKDQFWLGAFSVILGTYCGYRQEGKTLKELAMKYEAGRKGRAKWSGYDGYGGSCSKAKNKWYPHLLNKFQKGEEKYESWSNKSLCNIVLNFRKKTPSWVTTTRQKPAVDEAKKRGFSPEHCAVLKNLDLKASESIDLETVTKIAAIEKLQRDGMITDAEAEEKRQAILNDL